MDFDDWQPFDFLSAAFLQNSKASRDQANENDRIGAGSDQEIKVLEERESKERNVDLHLNLEKSERDDGDGVNAGNKSQLLTPKHQQLTEKSGRFYILLILWFWPLVWRSVDWDVEKFERFLNLGHSTSSLPLPMSMGNWPGGLAPMRYDCVPFCLKS